MAAQTFPQLYRELKTAGYRPDDVQRVHHAHEAASRLFAGAYRPTYKPFVCHLVGTASVLTRHRERVELIAAALVHSAYQLADFGDGSYGVTREKRRALREWIGDQAEGLVHDYHLMDWSRLETLDGSKEWDMPRELLALKLADIYEDYSDNTMKLAPSKVIVFTRDREKWFRDVLLRLARRAINAAFAEDLAALFDQVDAEHIDGFLVNQRNASFFERRSLLDQGNLKMRLRSVARSIKVACRRSSSAESPW